MTFTKSKKSTKEKGCKYFVDKYLLVTFYSKNNMIDNCYLINKIDFFEEPTVI